MSHGRYPARIANPIAPILASAKSNTKNPAERRGRTGVRINDGRAGGIATAAGVLPPLGDVDGGASSSDTGMIPANVAGKGAPRAPELRFDEDESEKDRAEGALSACSIAALSCARRSSIRSPTTFFTNAATSPSVTGAPSPAIA